MEIGEAIGWRAWRVVEDEDELRLASVLYDDVWPPGEPLRAACVSGHRAPDFDCTCGVYAARRPELARPYRVGRDDARTVCRVLGRVALWGDVVEHRDGWRASHAYPLELWLPPEATALRAYRASTCTSPASVRTLIERGARSSWTMPRTWVSPASVRVSTA
jgi:hypothetical protein